MEVCPQQLIALKLILNTFADSTWLKVNYSKSSMFSINISDERLNHLASTFQCKAKNIKFNLATSTITTENTSADHTISILHMQGLPDQHHPTKPSNQPISDQIVQGAPPPPEFQSFPILKGNLIILSREEDQLIITSIIFSLKIGFHSKISL
jgi:hypothetical protein